MLLSSLAGPLHPSPGEQKSSLVRIRRSLPFLHISRALAVYNTWGTCRSLAMWLGFEADSPARTLHFDCVFHLVSAILTLLPCTTHHRSMLVALHRPVGSLRIDRLTGAFVSLHLRHRKGARSMHVTQAPLIGCGGNFHSTPTNHYGTAWRRLTSVMIARGMLIMAEVSTRQVGLASSVASHFPFSEVFRKAVVPPL